MDARATAITLEFPEEQWQALLAVAQREGQTPQQVAQWAVLYWLQEYWLAEKARVTGGERSSPFAVAGARDAASMAAGGADCVTSPP